MHTCSRGPAAHCDYHPADGGGRQYVSASARVTRRGERREVGSPTTAISKAAGTSAPSPTIRTPTSTMRPTHPPISSQRAGLPGTSGVDLGKRAIKTLDLVDQLDRLVLRTTRELSCDDKIGFIRIGLNHPMRSFPLLACVVVALAEHLPGPTGRDENGRGQTINFATMCLSSRWALQPI